MKSSSATTMLQRRRSDLVRSLDNIRPTPLKADIAPSDHRTTQTFGGVVQDALKAHYGSVKEAAYALGEGKGLPKLDESLMMREFAAGKLARLEADETAKACVARALHAKFAKDDPKQRIKQIFRDARAKLDELEDAVTA